MISTDVIQGGLNALTSLADSIYLCSSLPTTFTEATSTFALGHQTFSVGSAVSSPGARFNARQVTTSNITAGTTTGTGAAYYYGITAASGSKLLVAGKLLGRISLTSGTPFSLAPFPVILPAKRAGWDQLKVGGGGYMRGMMQANDGSLCARTDVFGGYIFDKTVPNPGNAGGLGRWRQVVNKDSMPDGMAQIGLQPGNAFTDIFGRGVGLGCYDIAFAPSDSTRVYMVWCETMWSSTDNGNTWTRQTGWTKGTTLVEPNTNGMNNNRRLVVDPINPDHVWFACANKVSFSQDGAVTWTDVSNSSVPGQNFSYSSGGQPTAGGAFAGLLVTFDPTSSVVSGRTQGIYVASWGNGVYHTADGGSTWTFLNTTGMPLSHLNLVCDQTGRLWVVDEEIAQYMGDIHRYTSGGGWVNVTSGYGAGSNKRLTHSLAICPNDSTYVIGIQDSGAMMVSRSNGDFGSWVGPWQCPPNNAPGSDATMSSPDIPWLADSSTYQSGGNVIFDNQDTSGAGATSNKIYVAMGMGVYHTNPTTTGPNYGQFSQWVSQTAGIENMVSLGIDSAPGGYIMVSQWDRQTIVLQDLTLFASKTSPVDADFKLSHRADYRGGTPATVITDAAWNNVSTAGISTDKGVTWTSFATAPPHFSGFCLIAISNAGSLLSCPFYDDIAADQTVPAYSHNSGATWTACTFPPEVPTGAGVTNGWGRGGFPSLQRTCLADKTDSDTFYLYNNGPSGHSSAVGWYKSTDGGVTWTHINTLTFASDSDGSTYTAFHSDAYNTRAVPGHAGHLFLSPGNVGFINYPHTSRNFWRSTDHGTTWQSLTGVTETFGFGFGAPNPKGSGYPSILIMGWVNGVGGTWICDNGDQVGSETWTQISDLWPNNLMDFCTSFSADMNTYGRCYVGYNGSSCVWYH